MANTDISAELYEQISKRFDDLRFSDKTTEALRQKLRTQWKGLSYKDGHAYSKLIGEHMSQALQEVLTVDVLPNETLYYNIAQKTLGRAMYQDATLINEAAQNVQTAMNARAGINLAPVNVPVSEEAISEVVQKAAGLNTAEEIKTALDLPVVTHAMKVMDYNLQANARFHDESGLDVRVEREYDGVGLHDGSDVCTWCTDRAGKWSYEEAVDNGVFGRHEGCGCTIDYVTRKNKRERGVGHVDPTTGRRTNAWDFS